MAYVRWCNESDFYAFWDAVDSGKSKESQALAMWHKDHKEREYSITYKDCRLVLDSNNFSRIPGFVEKHQFLVKDVLKSFVSEVDGDSEFNG